ncbi:MAG: ABC transporter ATP-binding protein [Treponema sp.]|nr:ABC transporter ATP-binding protein [Treponema sp.]
MEGKLDNNGNGENIIEVKNLSKQFNLEAGFFAKNKNKVYAVNNVSFSIKKGETYGIVGESGCGKTTTARLIIQMYRQTEGSVIYTSGDGVSHKVEDFSKKDLRRYREKIKYIFQDPARSLNPRLSVFNVITAGLRYSSLWKGKKEAWKLAEKIIAEVGLSPEDLNRRPAEFSGGQRQRISIARGLIMNPELLICDEVVSALDVSIQGQIINLLQELKQKHNLSYVFITHDLRVACYFCDVIGVMYRGVLVEEAPAQNLYKEALHPYTKILFDGAVGELTSSNIEVKTTLQAEQCCPFAYRCPKATERCKRELPEFSDAGEGHRVRCFLLG